MIWAAPYSVSILSFMVIISKRSFFVVQNGDVKSIDKIDFIRAGIFKLEKKIECRVVASVISISYTLQEAEIETEYIEISLLSSVYIT